MFIVSIILIILGTIPVFIIFYNSLLEDYNYERDHIKYPFKLRAKYSFSIGLTLIIIGILTI